jgi:hypothetical protein
MGKNSEGNSSLTRSTAKSRTANENAEIWLAPEQQTPHLLTPAIRRKLRWRGLNIGCSTLIREITQVATRVKALGLARWTFHFLSAEWNLRGRGKQVVDELAFLADLRMSNARKTISAVYHPP